MLKQKRSKTPSNAVTSGAGVGGAIGTVIDIGATVAGHPLPPGTGAALGGALAALFAYFAKGGRHGESD